jgi:hypothetical protein
MSKTSSGTACASRRRRRTRLFVLAGALAAVLAGGPPAGAITAVDQVATGNPLANTGCTRPSSKTFYRPGDATAFLWISFTGALEDDVAEWRWFAPDGSLYVTSDFPIGFDGDGCAWSGINIDGQRAADLRGEWRVDFYFNDTLARSARFTIDTVPPPGPGAAHLDLLANDQALVPWGQVHLGYRVQSFRSGLPVDLYVALLPTDGTQCVSPDLVFAPGLAPEAAGVALANTQGVIETGRLPAHVDGRTATLYGVLVRAGTSPTDPANFVSDVAALDLVFANLSSTQDAVIAALGNPLAYVISFDHARRRRLETWRYPGGVHFQFLNGGAVGDAPPVESLTGAGSRATGWDPGRFSPAMTATDLRNLLGDPSRVVSGATAARQAWIFGDAGITVTLDAGVVVQVEVR